jgi:signal transduction histidine kinase
MRRQQAGDTREAIRHAFLCMALCHELKQPLHSLNLNIELLSKRLGPEARTQEIGAPLQAFGRVVDRVGSCLDAFAARTLPPPLRDETADVASLLEQAAARVRDERPDVRVAMTAAATPPIPGDADQLAYALDALVENALRAMPHGGALVLQARAGDDELHIEVVDDGIGMAPEVARHAFDIGYSTWGGDGVGLTLAKFIIYHHTGGFSLSSRPRHGTTVSIVLPTTSEIGSGAVGD